MEKSKAEEIVRIRTAYQAHREELLEAEQAKIYAALSPAEKSWADFLERLRVASYCLVSSPAQILYISIVALVVIILLACTTGHNY